MQIAFGTERVREGKREGRRRGKIMDIGTGRRKPETRCPKDNQPSKAIQIKRVQYKDEYS